MRGTVLLNYFEINSSLQRRIHSKCFIYFSSWGHLVHWKETVFSNLGTKSWEKHFCENILKPINRLEYRCCSKFLFSVLALVAILLCGEKLYKQFWYTVPWEEHLCKISAKNTKHFLRKRGFYCFASFSIGGHFGFSTRLNFNESEALEFHVKFERQGFQRM